MKRKVIYFFLVVFLLFVSIQSYTLKLSPLYIALSFFVFTIISMLGLRWISTKKNIGTKKGN